MSKSEMLAGIGQFLSDSLLSLGTEMGQSEAEITLAKERFSGVWGVVASTLHVELDETEVQKLFEDTLDPRTLSICAKLPKIVQLVQQRLAGVMELKEDLSSKDDDPCNNCSEEKDCYDCSLFHKSSLGQ